MKIKKQKKSAGKTLENNRRESVVVVELAIDCIQDMTLIYIHTHTKD